jgi:hypothetical protein
MQVALNGRRDSFNMAEPSADEVDIFFGKAANKSAGPHVPELFFEYAQLLAEDNAILQNGCKIPFDAGHLQRVRSR